MVNILSRRIKTLAAVTEDAGSIGLCIEIEEESPIGDSQTAMKNVKCILQLN